MKTIKLNQDQRHTSLWMQALGGMTKALSAVALCAVLAACGGGGGGSGSADTGTNTNPQGGNAQTSAFAAMHWTVGPSLSASGAITTYMPSLANISEGKVMAVFAQSEAGGNQLYWTLGDLASGAWTAPVPITGYVGIVQGVNDGASWAQRPSATVVSANPVTGVATAAWTSQVAGEATLRVWLSSYSLSGNAWTTPVQTGTTTVSGLQITRSAAGATLIGWLSASTLNTGTQALNLYLLSAAGAPVTDRLELGASPNAALKLGLSDANTVVVTWAGASQSVMLARKTGGNWAATVNLGAGAPASGSDLDLIVNADGSDAVAWGGVDPSIRTVLHDSSGAPIVSQLIAQGTFANVRPALGSLGAGQYTLVFAASSLSGVGVGYFEPYSASYTPGAGWSAPSAMDPNGASGTGNLQLRVDAAGNALAVNLGYNLNGYALPSGASAWTVAPNIVYGGLIPAFVQERATGRGVMLWCNGSQLQSAFFR